MQERRDAPHEQSTERQRDEQPYQQANGRDRRPRGARGDELGLKQHLASRGCAGFWNEDVARTRGQEIGHVEAGAPAKHARHVMAGVWSKITERIRAVTTNAPAG